MADGRYDASATQRGRVTPLSPSRAHRTVTDLAMHVRKRNGDTEPVDVNKIVRAVQRVADDLHEVGPMRVATRTISGLYDGASTAELDRLSIQTAAEMIGEEPAYSRLAGWRATSTTRSATSGSRPSASRCRSAIPRS